VFGTGIHYVIKASINLVAGLFDSGSARIIVVIVKLKNTGVADGFLCLCLIPSLSFDCSDVESVISHV
jgi:hypothetical protein